MYYYGQLYAYLKIKGVMNIVFQCLCAGYSMYNYVEKMFGTITIDSAGQISSKTAFEYF